MRGSAVFDQLSAGDFSLDTATTRLTMNSAEGVVQRGVVELGRPAASRVPAGTVEVVRVRALLLGERLDTRALERDKPLGIAPLTVEIAGGGMAVLFRYGAIVLFGMATAAMDSFVASLKPFIAGILPGPGTGWRSSIGSARHRRAGRPFRQHHTAREDAGTTAARRRHTRQEPGTFALRNKDRRHLRPHRAARRDIAGKGTRRGNQQ